MNTKQKGELKHECEIPPEEKVTAKFINSGLFVSSRRKFRRWLTVSGSSPRSMLYLKSTYMINKEQVRHLLHHYHMIHPLSAFRYHWETFMIFILIFSLILVPIKMVYPSLALRVLLRVLVFIMLFDVILTFNTGFIDEHSNTVVMQRRKVFIFIIGHGLGAFMGDVIPLLEFDFFEHMFKVQSFLVGPHMLHYLKILKIHKLFCYLNNYRQYKQITVNDMKIFKVVFIVFTIILWTLSIVVLCETYKGHHKEADTKTIFFLNCVRRTVYMLFLFGVYDVEKEPIFLMVQIICLCAGAFLSLLVASQFLMLYTRYSWADKKHFQTATQLQEFMRFKNLPQTLRNRIEKYSDYRNQLSSFREWCVAKTSSLEMHQEIMLHVKIHLLERVELFKELPMNIIFSLICSLASSIFLPGDTISMAGSLGDAMYFISTGSVAIYTATGKEISHLSDGDHFGEISLVLENYRRTTTIVAIECCEMHVLYRRQFLKEMEPYPEELERVKSVANEILARKFGVYK